jgi:hypothetical protein
MKTISIILFLLTIAFKNFAFGGGHDSLLFDGAVSHELPKNADCKIKLTFVEVGIEVTKFTTEVLEICGEVNKEIKTEKVIMTKPGEIPLGSEIVTGPNTYAELELWDGGIIRIAPNSTIRITSDFCDNRNLIQKTTSKVWHRIKNLLGGGGYEVTTNGAVGGVRGTEFEVITENDKTIFKVYEGKVEVTPILNDATNKLVIKAYEKLIEDMQSGKITMEEYTEKIIEMNEIMEGSRQFPGVMIEAGNMVEVTYQVSEIKTIPTDEDRWFVDSKFNR